MEDLQLLQKLRGTSTLTEEEQAALRDDMLSCTLALGEDRQVIGQLLLQPLKRLLNIY